MHNSCGHEYPVREIWKRSYACKSYFPFQGLTFWILIYHVYTGRSNQNQCNLSFEKNVINSIDVNSSNWIIIIMLNSIYRIQTSQTSGRNYKSCSPLYSTSTTWRITGYIWRDYFLGGWGIKGKRPNPTPSRTCTLVAEFTTNLCITSQCLRKTFSIEVCPSIYIFHFKSSK